MDARVAGNFADFLSRHRDRLNARFAQTLRHHPRLDPTTFGNWLAEEAAPIVERVSLCVPAAADEVAEAMFQITLDLMAGGPAMQQDRLAWIRKAWQAIGREHARLAGHDPRRVITALTNAIFNLSEMEGVRPQAWLDRIGRIAGLTTSIEDLLQAGQVAAWLAGMAHYREQALALCRTMAPEMVMALIPEAFEGPAAEATADLLERCRGDPWFVPGSRAVRGDGLQLVRRVGGFRGFGGPFLRPPTVRSCGAQFLVADGEHQWRLFVDAFGSVLIRDDGAEPIPTKTDFIVDGDGTVRHGRLTARFDGIRQVASYAANADTLVVAGPTSHRLSVIARKGSHGRGEG